MTNCVHPDAYIEAFSKNLNHTDQARSRFKRIQANSGCLIPEELDDSKELICSDSDHLSNSMKTLKMAYSLNVFGGCCGTNVEYMTKMMKAVISPMREE